MTAFRRPAPDEVARVTTTAAELLEVVWGRASTAPTSASQLRVLHILEHHDGINLRTLAESLASTPPSTSGVCAGVVPAGFVAGGGGPHARRAVRRHLSGRGRTFLADLRARREKELSRVLADMPAAKRVALLEGLEAFCASAATQLHDAPGSDSRTA